MKYKKNSKKSLAVISVILVIILILGGTYAWTDYSQHKSNEFSTGEKYLYDVTLIDDFIEVKDWQEGQEITSNIRVKNMSTATGDAYVRLSLKEYLEYGDLEEVFSDERYMIDIQGAFLKSDKDTSAAALSEILSTWPDSRYQAITEEDLVQDSGYVDNGDNYWYVKTKGGDPNGQYGKFLLRTSEYETESLVPGVVRSYDAYDEVWHQRYPNGECNYTTRIWPSDITDLNTSDMYNFTNYVSWKLGADVEVINGWDGFDSKDAKWYLDTIEGYAYWGKVLSPGEATGNLLETVTLKYRPDADYFYYNVHADMEAVSDGSDFDEEPADKEKSAPPVIAPVRSTDTLVTGNGVPGADVTVIFPDSTERTTEVDPTGAWSVMAPGRLYEGDLILANQTEQGKTTSDNVQTTILGPS